MYIFVIASTQRSPQQSIFLLFYLRKCAKEHHRQQYKEKEQKVEEDKEAIAEDSKNSCCLFYMQHNYQFKLSDPSNRATRCSYQMTNGTLGWLQLSSIIVGLLSLQMYLGNEQMYLTVSPNANRRHKLLCYFNLFWKINDLMIYLQGTHPTKDMMK